MVLGLAAALGLAACGSAPTDSTTTQTAGFKACMVSDEGGFDDQSFNQSGMEGLQRAKDELGVDIVGVESSSDADFQPNIDSLIQQNCNLIIGVGFVIAPALTEAAQANPDVQFAIIDSSFQSADGQTVELENGKPLSFNTAEASYLAGYVAAGTTKTGTVATYGGVAIPTVQIFMEGFAQGVAKYNADHGTNVQVLGWDPANPDAGSFTGDFTDTAKGQQLTQQFLSQGADIILPVAGPVGQGTLAALQDSGSTTSAAIWVDADGYNTTEFGSYMLTSVIKEIGNAVYDTVEQSANGKFTNEPYVGTLENGGVSIADFHDWDANVSADLKKEVEEIKQQIIDGTLDVSTAYDPS
nr:MULTISPECIES: BMP family ABC transporter substrate-binding protein [unclassified Actinomyces]